MCIRDRSTWGYNKTKMVSLLNPSGTGFDQLQIKGESDGITYIRIISQDNQEFFLDESIAELCPVFIHKLADCLEYPTQEIKILSHIPSAGTSPTRKEEEYDKASEFKTIKTETVRGEILELVIQYLHYKKRFQFEPKHQVPQFYIQPEYGLDVLKASLDLKI
eukprot:TRINITY_DN41749_c0_g1_i2.p1 TRINITY_DN41749_c0_g1~~TRINITY_DN41749_c0_g1_i2.p1  ORF type:complete len:163 (-),score=21.66 TRINITY_DN41749_c0_g1_i2:82-570(-)